MIATAFYNSGLFYNSPKESVYNSGPYAILIYDSGIGTDTIAKILSSANISDIGTGTDAIQASATLSPITDAGTGQDIIFPSINVNIVDTASGQDNLSFKMDVGVADTGAGQDNLSVSTDVHISDAGTGQDSASALANVNIADTGSGQDIVRLVTCNVKIIDTGTGEETIGIAKTIFIITNDGILKPLDVLVLADSRYDMFASLKEFSEELPGKHGEISFGSKLGSKMLELHVASPDGMSPADKENFKRECAKFLNPTNGVEPLIFGDDIEKTYYVKYAGKIDPTQYADWLEFTIPFKMNNPYIIGSFERMQEGSGTIVNNGTVETGLIISITGPATNPSLTIGDKTLSYAGTIPAGQTLIIDTEKMTAYLSGANVLGNLSGNLPLLLQPGSTGVTAGSNVTINWRERWN